MQKVHNYLLILTAPCRHTVLMVVLLNRLVVSSHVIFWRFSIVTIKVNILMRKSLLSPLSGQGGHSPDLRVLHWSHANHWVQKIVLSQRHARHALVAPKPPGPIKLLVWLLEYFGCQIVHNQIITFTKNFLHANFRKISFCFLLHWLNKHN